MQKTVKTGFRGERKRILTPSLSQGEGECDDGKLKETFPLPHTPLSRTSSMRGIVATERGNVETEKVLRAFQENGGVVMFSSVCQLSKMNFLPSSAKKTFLKTSCVSCLKRLTSG